MKEAIELTFMLIIGIVGIILTLIIIYILSEIFDFIRNEKSIDFYERMQGAFIFSIIIFIIIMIGFFINSFLT
jgi:hypothetical protein